MWTGGAKRRAAVDTRVCADEPCAAPRRAPRGRARLRSSLIAATALCGVCAAFPQFAHAQVVDTDPGGAGAIVLTDGTGLRFTAPGTYSRNVTVAGDPTFDTSAGTITYSGLIADGGTPGDVEVIGGHTLILTNTGNSYSGGTVVKGGSALRIGADHQLGDPSGGLTLGDATTGGELDAASSFTLAPTRAVTLGAGGGGIYAPTDAILTIGQGITGAGALLKLGDGKLALLGANTYTGGTTVSAGRLQIGNNGTTGSIAGNVVDNAELLFYRSDDTDFGGNISGTGELLKAGIGTLTLTGDNTNASTTIANGVLRIGDGGTSGSISGYVLDNAVLEFDRSDDVTFAGGASGTGVLVKAGSGTLTLTGVNYYDMYNDDPSTPDVTISAGTLRVGAGGTTGFLSATVLDNGALVLDRSDTVEYEKVVSGSGSLTQAGQGTLILSGENTYTGGTTVSAGTLQIGTDSTFGSIVGNIVDDAAVVFDRYNNITFPGEISGGGSLTQAGAGTLTLTGANTYTGGTTISNGKLQIGAGGATGSTTGDVVDNGALTFYRSDDITFPGDISGGGSVTQAGAGTLTLTGNSTYGGGTTISDGTLQIGAGGATGSITGDVVDNTALVFDRSDKIAFAGGISGTGSLTQAGVGKLTLTGVNTYTGPTLVDAGMLVVNSSIASSSGITVAPGAALGGSGVLPDIVINGTVAPGNSIGTLRVSGDVTFGPGSVYQVQVSPTAADLIDAGGTASLAGTLDAIALGGSYRVGSYTVLTAAGGVSGQFDQLLATGFGGLLTSLSYDANDVYLRLRLSDARIDLSQPYFVPSDPAARQSPIEFDGGTLRVGGTTFTAPVTLDETGGVVDTIAGDGAFTGVVSGPGGLTVQGGGTFFLTGANTYQGGTNVHGAVLSINGDEALGDAGGGVTLDGGAIAFTQDTTASRDFTLLSGGGGLNTNANTVTLAGQIAGPGALVKSGGGTLVLTGSDTYGGGTLISGGALRIGDGAAAGSITGNVDDNAVLIFDRADNVVFPGAIFGSGSLIQAGSGTLTLTAANTFSGLTTISAGNLALLGSLAGPALISGGTLSGAGHVGGVVTLASGRLSPGTAAGGFGVLATGALNATGGALVTDFGGISTGFASDALVVNGAVSLGGAVVDAHPASPTGAYTFDQKYLIVAATGAIGGAFANPAAFTANPYDADLSQRLRYDLGGVVLEVRRLIDFSSDAATPNQHAVADNLLGTEPDADDGWADVLNALHALAPSLQPAALDLLSGEGIADVSETTMEGLERFLTLVQARSGGGQDAGFPALAGLDAPAGRSPYVMLASMAGTSGLLSGAAPRQRGVWASGFGARRALDGRAGQADVRSNAAGLAMGADTPVGQKIQIGVAGGVADVNADVAARRTSADGHAYYLAAYARVADAGWFGSLTGGWGRTDLGLTRIVGVSGAVAKGDTDATTYGASATAGLRLPAGGGELQPLASAAWTYSRQDGFAETGAGPLGLTVAQITTQRLTGTVGGRWIEGFRAGGVTVTPQLNAALAVAGGDRRGSMLASFEGAPSAAGSFAVAGAELPRSWAQVGAGVTVGSDDDRVAVGVSYAGAFSNRLAENQLSASLRLRW